jgi:hypothetical protein
VATLPFTFYFGITTAIAAVKEMLLLKFLLLLQVQFSNVDLV